MPSRYGWSCLLAAALLLACGGESEPSDVPGPAVALETASAAEQRVVPGNDAQPLIVRAVDSAGRGVPGVTVTFRASAGSGILLDRDGVSRGSIAVTTGADGNASATWRSNHTDVPDSATVSASSPDLPAVSFKLVVGYPEPPLGPAIAAGSTYTCDGFLRSDVACWGSHAKGWALAAGFNTISAFEGTVCAAAGEGRHCVGNNTAGQFGNGTSGTVAEDAVTIADGHRFLSLAIGGLHGCGVDEHARLYCWSRASAATLPPGSAMSGLPELVGHGYSQVASGHDFMCALHVTGEVHCRGSNSRGQLGGAVADGFSRLSGPYVEVVASHEHACALGDDGTARCWGRNDAGQLGDGSRVDRTTPSTVSGNLDLVSLATGRTHTCGIDLAAEVFCWGSNVSGELGNDTFDDANAPVPVSASHAFTGLAVGDRHSCGLLANGRRACWGETAMRAVPIERGFIDPLRLPIANADALWPTGGGFCARTPSGASCWPGADVDDMQELPQATGMETVFLSAFGGCGLQSDGTAMCWGENSHGQLGNGTIGGSTSTPGPVAGGLRFSKLAMGLAHVCGLTTDSEIWCWGGNEVGELGIGTSGTPSGTPLTVSGSVLYTDLAAGYSHSCGLDQSGRAHCWGSNLGGQLGDLSTIDRAAPVPVEGARTFTTIFAVAQRSCALAAGGEAFCWGSSSNVGALGYRPEPNVCGAFGGTCSAAPGQVQTQARFSALALSFWNSCGIDGEGFAWCWGDWSYGARGSTHLGGDKVVPNRIMADLRFEEIAAGNWTNCGRTPTGEIHCWGRINEWTGIFDFTSGMPRPFRF